jgi:hypothetical protein
MSQEYDVQQVCENGHQITCGFHTHPEEQKKFCPDCGASTITACPACGKEIQGAKMRHIMTMSDLGVSHHRKALEDIVSLPSYCTNCGEPYPWTQRKIAAAIQAFIESGKLDKEEEKIISKDIENISKDIPDAEPSAIRIKGIWEKYGPICRELILELMSRTAAKILQGLWL